MQFYNKSYTKQEILKRVGDMSQLGGVKLYEFADGTSKGIKAAEVKSSDGLDMIVLIDRCMDISSLTYKGKSYLKSKT